MGRYDPDYRSSDDRAAGITQQAAESGDAAAGSLMSMEIRRSRLARKRPPPGSTSAPAASTPEAACGEPAGGTPEKASPRVTAPATQSSPDIAQPMHEMRRPESITAYWSRLRGGRPFPPASDLDSDRIATDWPNSILFRCRSGSQALEPDTTYRPRGGGEPMTLGSEPEPGVIDLSPMMLQWLLSLAGEVVRFRRPVEDTESFPSVHRSITYRAIALPLSETRSAIDHVLCHVQQI